MPDSPARPILVSLTSHWVSMLGVSLVTLAGSAWFFVLPMNLGGHANSPYMGLLVFIAIPVVFFAGLALIPIGIALSKRCLAETFATLEDRRIAWRRAGIFFAVMTFVNVVIGSQLTYRAAEHMETVQFCGQSCHVMKPEFTGHQMPPHQNVACASCHIVPGAKGWVQAKLSGTRQLIDVMFNTFPRPIESAMASNRLVPSAETCEQCHARGVFIGPRMRVLTKYKDDENNSRTETVLMMQVGGGRAGGIHGAHMGPGVQIRYAATDRKRQTIPWIEYRNIETNATRTYLAADAKPESIRSIPVFEMQCVDCHNRAAHSFELPDYAVDNAIAGERIPAGLPFVKKTGVELIKADYKTDEEAGQKIPADLIAFYRLKYPDIALKRAADIQAAGQSLLQAYRENVFPDLKVTWGTYPNNLGHTDSTGCFRCHDENHATSDKKRITQDCNTCHQSLAADEPAPEVLKRLGLADQITSSQKQ